jgi:DNA mismatch endonuclease (patch repair protein)
MADRISEERRSYIMSRVGSADTDIELMARRLLTRLGFRYRLHDRSLPGRPDIVFKGKRKAIFVHGCFWHQHSSAQCTDSRRPASNGDYWGPKLAQNVHRDETNLNELSRLGWAVLVIWGCRLERHQDLVEREIRAFLAA